MTPPPTVTVEGNCCSLLFQPYLHSIRLIILIKLVPLRETIVLEEFDSFSSFGYSSRSDSGFGGASAYGSSASSKRETSVESPKKQPDLDGLTPFEKNFYVESPSVAAMTEAQVEEYRRMREITVEGRDIPKPVKSFRDVGFPGMSCPVHP